MHLEKLKMNTSYTNRLIQMLKQNGLSLEDIDVIVNDSYNKYSSPSEITFPMIFKNEEYNNIIQALSQDYTFEQMSFKLKISQSKIDSFKKNLDDNNLTIESVKAFNTYSIDSNMILSAKRGLPKEIISKKIDEDFELRLKEYGFSQTQISKVYNYVNSLDYSKPLYENWQITEFLNENEISKKFAPVINNYIMHKNSLAHLNEILLSLDQGLTFKLPNSLKLTRAVKKDYLINLLNSDDLTSLIGNKIEEFGYSSTSLIYDTSFAKYDDFDVVYDIYAPKGTQGVFITPFSSYGTSEEEVLLNSNDLYIFDVIPNVIDKNGKEKTIIKAIVLSKDMSCYQQIGNKNDIKNKYNYYREKLNEYYLKEKSSNTFLKLSFIITEGQMPKCYLYLEQINGQEKTILMQNIFEYNDDFKKNMLIPTIIDYAQRNHITLSKIDKNLVNLNEKNVDLKVLSETDNALIINNVDPDFAKKIVSLLENEKPFKFDQNNNQLNQDSISTLNMTGFSNVLLIFFVIAIICIVGIVLGLFFMN